MKFQLVVVRPCSKPTPQYLGISAGGTMPLYRCLDCGEHTYRKDKVIEHKEWVEDRISIEQLREMLNEQAE